VRTYADSSFLLRLLTGETDSPDAIAQYRRLGKPRLFYLAIHALEVRTAILQRAFHGRRSLSGSERANVAHIRDAAFGRLELLLNVVPWSMFDVDLRATLTTAIAITNAQTERLGARSMDILHVACAQTLETELFITCDHRQAEIAKREGLKAEFVSANS
jgi:predicted nucleic acid-binding protein